MCGSVYMYIYFHTICANETIHEHALRHNESLLAMGVLSDTTNSAQTIFKSELILRYTC